VESNEELSEMIQHADFNEDGKISIDDFMQLLQSE